MVVHGSPADGLSIAVLGAGEISAYHLAALTALPRVRVAVVAARTAASARRAATLFGVPEWSDDAIGTIRRPDVGAVVIATPDETHSELALEAISAGKPALVQKPFALTSESAFSLARAADSAGTLLCASFMHRYLDEVVALRRLLDDGALGRVESVRIRNASPGPGWSAWFYRPQLAGLSGVVPQLGVHGIDLVRYLFGPILEVQAVTAITREYRTLDDGQVIENQVTDTAFAHYRLANSIVSHEMSFIETAGTDRFRLEVYGSEGVAWLRNPTDGLRFSLRSVDAGAWQSLNLPGGDAGLRQHQSFVDQAIGKSPADGSAFDAALGLRVAEAVHESAEQRRWIEVEP